MHRARPCVRRPLTACPSDLHRVDRLVGARTGPARSGSAAALRYDDDDEAADEAADEADDEADEAEVLDRLRAAELRSPERPDGPDSVQAPGLGLGARVCVLGPTTDGWGPHRIGAGILHGGARGAWWAQKRASE